MTLGQYSLGMTVITVIGWLLVVTVIWTIDPTTTGVWGFVYFYAGLFFAVTATGTLMGLLWRRVFLRQRSALTQLVVALRQGVLFGIAVVGSFLLLSFGLLSLMNAVLLVALLTAVEFFARPAEAVSSSTE